MFGSAPATPENEEKNVTTLRIAAARVKQGSLTLYAIALPVRELIAPGFYSVKTLDPEDAIWTLENTGATKLIIGDYLVSKKKSG